MQLMQLMQLMRDKAFTVVSYMTTRKIAMDTTFIRQVMKATPAT